MSPQKANVILGIILAILAFTWLIPFLLRQREAQAKGQTMNRLREVVQATHSCNDALRRLPPAFDGFALISYPASLHVHLLPYLKQDALYQSFLKGKGKEEYVAVFHAPSDYSGGPMEGVQNFAANLRVFSDKGFTTAWTRDMPALAKIESGSASIPRTFVDGTSNTIVLATKLGTCGEGGSR